MRIFSACHKLFTSFNFRGCLIIFLLVFSNFGGTLFAQESTSTAQVSEGQVDEALLKTVPIRFLPSHPLYFLITIKENVSRFFKPSAAQRAEFDFILSGKRLKETHMLMEENDFDKASKNLARYSKRLGKMIEQIEKARAQNQDIAKIVGVIADGFKHHEVFLISFSEDSMQLGSSLGVAIDRFEEAVLSVNRLNPGIKDRFKILQTMDVQDRESSPSPSVESESTQLIEATPSVRPRRIIF